MHRLLCDRLGAQRALVSILVFTTTLHFIDLRCLGGRCEILLATGAVELAFVLLVLGRLRSCCDREAP